jgi:hypothetical protein
LRFEVARTRALLSDGRALVPRIPGALAVDIDLFSRGGSAILDAIEAQGYDVLKVRPALTRVAKARLLGRALVAMGMARLPGRRARMKPGGSAARKPVELATGRRPTEHSQ